MYIEKSTLYSDELTPEEKIIGFIIYIPKSRDNIFGRLLPKHFYNDVCKEIYQVTSSFFKEGSTIDIISVVKYFRGKIKAKTIIAIGDKMTYGDSVDEVILLVKERFLNKEQLKVYEKAINGLVEESDPFLVSDEVSSKLKEINSNVSENTIEKFSKDVMSFLSDSEDVTKINTGYFNLDKVIRGWINSSMIVVAARPGMGKTDFALNVMHKASEQEKKTLFFSLEMSREEITKRMVSIICNMQRPIIKKNLSTEQTDNILKLMGEHTNNIFIDDSGRNTMLTMNSIISRTKKEHGVDLVVIDYLQLINTKGSSRFEKVTDISREIKLMAKENNVPVIVLSQLSRSVEGRENKIPRLSDLRESGAIEQDADQVVFLYRPSYYNINENEEGDDVENLCEVIVAKNRHGEDGIISFDYNRKIGSFETQ